ncbi:dihydropterin-6-yl-methyl-4-(beta-D-ribofuranosyl)aminobenzene 5'-phosphate synthase 7-8 [Peptococcaceae bacterium DYL19]|nr:dihydropterin-6-yl-methyl-4-(beta-D-ribofuranosyl)aminobenzene 5'-phosphate synthase 7-8 [Phosphitispora fastidiosa]
MMKIIAYVILGVLVLGLLGFTVSVRSFSKNKEIAEASWNEYRPEKIANLGTVKELKIMPLIDYYTSNDTLSGEPGVSYLVSAGDKKIMFDVGFNMENEHPSPLLRNMNQLGVDIKEIDTIVISHNHVDHTGGIQAKKQDTFLLSGEEIDLSHVKALVPEKMVHSTAEVEVTPKPKKIADGIATIGTIDRAIWGMGLTSEQALVVNVEGKGLVLVVGCGHQKAARILERTRELFDVPIYGVIGGLHYPVEESRMKFNMQKIIGTGKLPWQKIEQQEVLEAAAELDKTNLSMIGISAHDSCDWTLDKFRELFRERYVDIMVGKEISVAR